MNNAVSSQYKPINKYKVIGVVVLAVGVFVIIYLAVSAASQGQSVKSPPLNQLTSPLTTEQPKESKPEEPKLATEDLESYKPSIETSPVAPLQLKELIANLPGKDPRAATDLLGQASSESGYSLAAAIHDYRLPSYWVRIIYQSEAQQSVKAIGFELEHFTQSLPVSQFFTPELLKSAQLFLVSAPTSGQAGVIRSQIVTASSTYQVVATLGPTSGFKTVNQKINDQAIQVDEHFVLPSWSRSVVTRISVADNLFLPREWKDWEGQPPITVIRQQPVP